MRVLWRVAVLVALGVYVLLLYWLLCLALVLPTLRKFFQKFLQKSRSRRGDTQS